MGGNTSSSGNITNSGNETNSENTIPGSGNTITNLFVKRPAQQEFGPWGLKDGGITLQNFELDDHSRFSNIRIAVDQDRIRSITFTYKDKNGDEIESPTYGGSGGVDHQFTLGDDEEITLIAGTYEDTTGITSLSVCTNNDVTHGPYGKTGSKSFSVPVSDHGKLIGFFGSHGDYINAIGVIVQRASPK